MDDGMVWLTIFVLSVFVGVEVISKVSSTLHTPLMSGANAIHGIILLGAVLVTVPGVGATRSCPCMGVRGPLQPDTDVGASLAVSARVSASASS